MTAEHYFQRAYSAYKALPDRLHSPSQRHTPLVESAIADLHHAIESSHEPEVNMVCQFLLAELTLIKAYIAYRSPLPDRQAVGKFLLGQVLSLTKTAFQYAGVTVFAGLDEEALYFSGQLKQPGMSREWDIKHLLAKYNQIVIDIQELEQLKFRGKAAKECYLCIRSSLPQIVQIAKLVLENKYENL